MSTTLYADPVATRWQAADPWVTAGIAALGELLTARGLTNANPASNGGAAYRNAVFTLEPGRFATEGLTVRWGRHLGGAGHQDRPCSRETWAGILAACRASLDG